MRRIFFKIFLCKTDKPQGGAILGPGVIIFRNLKEDHPRRFLCNLVEIGPVVYEKNFLKIFLWKTDKPLGGAIFGPGVIIFRNLKEDHPRNIPV